MIEQMLGNWVCWAIVLLAVACYHQLWLQFFLRRAANPDHSQQHTSQQRAQLGDQFDFTAILINALPLLGLLGTIIGLLDCFSDIASEGASGELMSGGIADALLTTQLGLVCAIPGWLLQAWIRSSTDVDRQLVAE